MGISHVAWNDLTALLPQLKHLDLQNNPVGNPPTPPLSLDSPNDVLEYVDVVGKANASGAKTRVDAASAGAMDVLDLAATDGTVCVTSSQVPWSRITMLVNVSTVSFAHQLLTTVDFSSLSALPTPRVLDLSHNLLSALSWSELNGLVTLQDLDLSGNDIKV